jgi:hypothetical protein
VHLAFELLEPAFWICDRAHGDQARLGGKQLVCGCPDGWLYGTGQQLPGTLEDVLAVLVAPN